MEKFEYTIKDEVGIHARPAGVIMKAAKEFSSEINVEKDGKKANLTRIMAVMGMGIKKGDTVTVTADGIDETAAIDRMKKLFEETL